MLRGRVLIVVSAFVALVLTLPVLVQLWLTGFGSGGDTVTGYPRRVQVQWLVTDLPQRPGPIAGLMQDWDDDSGPGWYAISARGTRWRITGMQRHGDQYPALSADGRYLGYLSEGQGYVIRDLVAGETINFERVGDNRVITATELHIYDQHPWFWSPDGGKLALAGYRTGDQHSRVLILGRDGSITELPDQQLLGHPIGWADNHKLAWLAVNHSQGADPPEPPENVVWKVTDLDGRELSAVTLVPDEPWGEVFGQWTGWLSQRGEVLAVAEERGVDRRLRLFDPRTGREVSHTDPYPRWLDVCPISWAGHDPAVPIMAGDPMGDSGKVHTINARTGAVLAAIQPSLDASCVYWADGALSGTGHRLLPAGWDSWPVWWWREAVFTILLLSAAITYFRRRRPIAAPQQPTAHASK